MLKSGSHLIFPGSEWNIVLYNLVKELWQGAKYHSIEQLKKIFLKKNKEQSNESSPQNGKHWIKKADY